MGSPKFADPTPHGSNPPLKTLWYAQYIDYAEHADQSADRKNAAAETDNAEHAESAREKKEKTESGRVALSGAPQSLSVLELHAANQ